MCSLLGDHYVLYFALFDFDWVVQTSNSDNTAPLPVLSASHGKERQACRRENERRGGWGMGIRIGTGRVSRFDYNHDEEHPRIIMYHIICIIDSSNGRLYSYKAYV